MRNRWGLTAAVAIVSFFTGGWLLQQGVKNDGNVYQQARQFDDVLSYIDRYYVDSLGESELYQRATDGLLEELHDPYSVLLTGNDYKALTETTTGNYGGLGIQIDVRDGWITVVAPLPDTPAERAGILTGDQIVSVNDKLTEGWNNEQAVKALRGDVGTKVDLQVRRPGTSGAIKYNLTRAQIHVRSVQTGTMFQGGVGFISLNPVSENSSSELRNEISGMQSKGMKAMILDLRGNPGGLLDQGVKVAELFLDSNQEIVSTRGRTRASNRRFLDDAKQTWPGLPIVVLVNEGTASAAEIVAGALQDHDRAVVIGTPTFGKGLVQTLYPLSETSALKLTTARWYTPSGRTIQRTARNEDDQAEQAAKAATAPVNTDTTTYHTDSGRLVKGGGGIVPDLTVTQDSLTPGERAFVQSMGPKIAEFRDVLTTYALEIKNDKSVTSESFQVTPAMRDKVYERLKAKGVTMSSDTFAGGVSLVDDQLGYEIARYVFGRPAEFRRRSQDDRQMQSELALLRKAQTPKELMDLALSRSTSTAKN